MFTYPTPPLNPETSLFGAGRTASSSGTSFEATLASATSAQSITGAFGAQKPDPVDEEKALRELFHILAMLSVGQVDYGSLAKCEGASGSQPGPRRMEVEALKEIIRRIMRGGAEDQEIDPKTGKPKILGTDQAFSSEASLSALFNSLPTEIQNLLRRAFPNLDQLILDELRERTSSKTDAAELNTVLPDPQAGIEETSLFLARLLDASNPRLHQPVHSASLEADKTRISNKSVS